MQRALPIPHQPRFGVGYFHFQRLEKLQKGFRQFYLSWEDGLWHLLSIQKVAVGSVILVPEFFCWDVVRNMEAHGLRVETYPVDQFLRTTAQELASAIEKTKPAIVVVLHPAGLTNPLLRTELSWQSALAPDTMLIEDSVHRMLQPSEISFLRPHHYLMDSLRKVVPVQGTWLYSEEKLPSLAMLDRVRTFRYRWEVTFWWTVFQLFLWLSALFEKTSPGRWLNQKAEDAMNRGYDVIGDSPAPSKGSWLFAQLSQFLNIEGIHQTKRKQAEWYAAELSHLKLDPVLFMIPVPTSDFGELRGYPVGLRVKHAADFSQYSRENGWLVRLELNDSPWSTRHKVFYLPLGPHISFDHQKQVIALCASFLQNRGREPYDENRHQK